MKTIMLIGFSAFGKYPQNSTALVAKHLNEQNISGYHFESHVLETAIFHVNIGEEFMQRAENMRAAAIICLGMASTAKGFKVETTAYNKIDSVYCPPEINGSVIDCKHAPEAHLSCDLIRWNIASFFGRCAEDKLSGEWSKDPGRFCCNQLMYSLEQANKARQKFQRIPWIFVHVPCSPECVPEPADEFYSAGKITLSVRQIEQGVEHLIMCLE